MIEIPLKTLSHSQDARQLGCTVGSPSFCRVQLLIMILLFRVSEEEQEKVEVEKEQRGRRRRQRLWQRWRRETPDPRSGVFQAADSFT